MGCFSFDIAFGIIVCAQKQFLLDVVFCVSLQKKSEQSNKDALIKTHKRSGGKTYTCLPDVFRLTIYECNTLFGQFLLKMQTLHRVARFQLLVGFHTDIIIMK